MKKIKLLLLLFIMIIIGIGGVKGLDFVYKEETDAISVSGYTFSPKYSTEPTL